jgi:hypothetical protein
MHEMAALVDFRKAGELGACERFVPAMTNNSQTLMRTNVKRLPRQILGFRTHEVSQLDDGVS